MDPPSFSCYPLETHMQIIRQSAKLLTVDAFVDQLGDGDLVFSRSNGFTGHLIQKSGHCIWNHVAMCIYQHWCEATNDDTLYAFDDVEIKNPREGVKIWDMKTGLKAALAGNFNSTLLFGVSRHKYITKDHIRDMWQFWRKEQGKPYTPHYYPLVLAWLDSTSTLKNTFCCWGGVEEDDGRDESDQLSLFKNKATTDDYFCSQIMVECLQQCGVMIREEFTHIPATEWTVANLANTHYRLKNNLCNNFKYTEIEFFHVKLTQ